MLVNQIAKFAFYSTNIFYLVIYFCAILFVGYFCLQVLECLKSIPNEDLTPECLRQMFKVRTQDMIDNSIDYTLVTMCQNMIKEFCDNYEPTRILDCLKVGTKSYYLKNLTSINS